MAKKNKKVKRMRFCQVCGKVFYHETWNSICSKACRKRRGIIRQQKYRERQKLLEFAESERARAVVNKPGKFMNEG